MSDMSQVSDGYHTFAELPRVAVVATLAHQKAATMTPRRSSAAHRRGDHEHR